MKRQILLAGLGMLLANPAFPTTNNPSTAQVSQVFEAYEKAPYTRVLLITPGASRNLRQVKGLDATKSTKDLLLDYLRQNGVEFVSPMYGRFDPTNQTLEVRATLPVLDKVQALLAKLSNVRSTARILSLTEAAQMAANLANDECERLFKRRPFVASQHAAVLENGEYRWGGLDVGAPGGYSAQVSFGRNGSKPKVEVYYSTDKLYQPAVSRLQPIPDLPRSR